MQHQLLSPKELAPTLSEGISPAKAVHIWIDLMRLADKLVMAGIASRVGREHAKDAYRRWYAEQAMRHGRHVAQLASRLGEAGEN
jgi:hypothetical protein